jgi:hypothetical protein
VRNFDWLSFTLLLIAFSGPSYFFRIEACHKLDFYSNFSFQLNEGGRTMISVNRLYFRSHYFYGVKIRSSIRFIFIFTCVVMCCSRSEPCCVLRCGECGHRPRFVCLLDFSFRFLDASIDCLLSLEFCLRWILRPFLSLTSSERFFVLASLPWICFVDLGAALASRFLLARQIWAKVSFLAARFSFAHLFFA